MGMTKDYGSGIGIVLNHKMSSFEGIPKRLSLPVADYQMGRRIRLPNF